MTIHNTEIEAGFQEKTELIDEMMELAISNLVNLSVGIVSKTGLPPDSQRPLAKEIARRVYKESCRNIEVFYNTPQKCK